MTNEKNLAEYPTYYGQKGRALVWLWRARAQYYLSKDAIDAVDDFAREMYEC